MDRLAAMEVFVRVLDCGSFSAAARQLRMSQPAVSKSVAHLEEWLNVRLLLRSTRSLVATEAGRNFYERARRAIEEADGAVLAAREVSDGLSGALRIAASVCFGRMHVIPNLPLLLDRHPNLTIEMILDDRRIDLVEEGIDVGLRMNVPPDSALIAQKLGQGRRLVMGTPRYLSKHGTPTSPQDLNAHQIVVFSRDGGGEEWIFRNGTGDAHVKVGGRVRVTAAEGLREAVLAGLGLAIASEWIFTPELASGAVRPVMDDWLLPSQDLWAVFPSGRLVSSKARTFALFMKAYMADSGPQRYASEQDHAFRWGCDRGI